MHALITGASGFIGNRIVRQLLKNPANRVTTVRRTETDDWRIVDICGNNYVIVMGSIPTWDIIRTIRNVDVTIHLGWKNVHNQKHMHETQLDNISISLNILKATINTGCKHWIGVGSEAEFGTYSDVVSNDYLPCPNTLYGTAKLATAHATRVVCHNNNMTHTWLRLFHAYGPADNDHRLIPYVIKALLNGETPSLNSAGAQMVDYLYADDMADALYACYVTKTDGIYNLGANDYHTVRSVVEKIRDIIDPSLELNFGTQVGRNMCADSSNLFERSGWVPSTKLEDGLKETIDWHRQHG